MEKQKEKKMKESALLKKFLLEYSRIGNRLFRANSGMGWAGKSEHHMKKATVVVNSGDVVIRKARPFRGMPKGTPDMIGWTSIKVTEEMVGKKVAVFTGFEAKTKNVKATKEQKNFIEAIKSAGGISSIVRKIDDVFEAINFFSKGAEEDEEKTRH